MVQCLAWDFESHLHSCHLALVQFISNKVYNIVKECKCYQKSYYDNKCKGLQDSKPQDWWREIKQICSAINIPKWDLTSLLDPNLVVLRR